MVKKGDIIFKIKHQKRIQISGQNRLFLYNFEMIVIKDQYTKEEGIISSCSFSCTVFSNCFKSGFWCVVVLLVKLCKV